MKTKRVLIVLLFSCLLPFTSMEVLALFPNQPDFTVDGIHYCKCSDNTVKVTYKAGTNSAYHYSYNGEVTIPRTVTYDNQAYTVVGISEGAFFSCNVTAVHLPSTIKFIEGAAFRNTSITDIDLPIGLDSIGKNCFENCKLTKVLIPAGITRIPYLAFSDTPLEEVTLPANLKIIAEGAFQRTKLEHIYLPEGLDTIKVGAFFQTSTLQDIRIPTTVKAIEHEAFMDCSGLTSVTFALPSQIKSIEHKAFYKAGLTSITIPSSVEQIGERAFSSCVIDNITFDSPSRLNTIEGGVFCENPLAGKITIPANVDSIGSRAFASSYYGNNGPVFEIIFEEGSKLKVISDRAFERSNLQSITLPAGLRKLGDAAFSYCLLEDVVLPEGLEIIGADCFRQCKLKTANVPSSVKTIGADAFMSNTGLLCLNLDSKTTDVGDYCFSNVKTINISDLDSWTRIVVERNPFYSFTAHVYFQGELVTEYTVPEGIENLHDLAFRENSDIKSVTLPNSLKSIGKQAFYKCTALEKVVFGNSLEEVGDEAFRYDAAINTVDIGDLANWCNISFYASTSNPITQAGRVVLNGKELDALTIPSTVTKISNFAFNGCRYFDKLTIPSSVTSIGVYAFNNCQDLETVTFRKGSQLETIDSNAFAGTSITGISFPSTLTNIGEYAFYSCKRLESVAIPEQMTEIANSTFSNCTNLSQLVLPDGLKKIGKYAFASCSALKRVDIPSSLTDMGAYAFNGLNLKVYVSDLAAWCNVKMDAYSQWCYASHLYLNDELIKDLVVPTGTIELSHHLFYGNTDLETVVIPEGVKTIGNNCFRYCYNLKSVQVPTTLEDVGSDAFYLPLSHTGEYPKHNVAFHTNDLSNFINSKMAESIFPLETYYGPYYGYSGVLYVNGEEVKDLVIPEDVQSIGAAFRGFNFTSVTLPKSLERIRYDVFQYCKQLKTFYCKSKFSPNIMNYGGKQTTTNFFISLESIYVPVGSLNNYKSNWSGHSKILFEAPNDYHPSGAITSSSLTTNLNAHYFVYGNNLPFVDLTDTTPDETVTQDIIRNIANQGTIIFLPDAMEKVEGQNIVSHGSTPKLLLRDSVDFASPYDFVAEELVYQRSFKASGTEATTLCLPYSMDELPKGMKAYSLKELDEQGDAVFDEVEVVEANTPYLITTTKNVASLTGQNVQFKATPVEMPNAGSEDCMFVGTLSAISHEDAAAEESYILGPGLRWQSVYDAFDDVYIPAGRARLIPSDVTGLSFASTLNIISPIEITPGDANCDGEVDVADIARVIDVMSGSADVSFVPADMNGDGVIDVADIATIIDVMAASARQQDIED